MSQEQLTVQIGEREYGYPEGTRYLEIAKEHQKDYDAEIILVKRDGKLQELSRVLETSCSLTFVTTRDKEGYDTYISTRRAYVEADGNMKELQSKLIADEVRNLMGELENEEFDAEKEEYEQAESATNDALGA